MVFRLDVAHLGLRTNELSYVEIGNIIAEIIILGESKLLRRGGQPL